MNVLPKGWVDTTLGEVCRVEYGKGLSANQRTESGAVPVVGSAGVIGRHSVSLVPGPVIVIGRKGNAGAIHLLRDACWPIDTTYFVRVPPPFDPAFLAYQLRDAQLRSLDSSTAVPSLRRPDLEACPLLVAPSRDQQRIVAVIEEQVSRLDTAEQLLRSALQRCDVLYRSFMRTLEEWPLVPLADLLEKPLANGRSVPTAENGSGFPVLRLTALRNGFVDLSERKVGAWGRREAERYIVQEGDFLIARGNGSLALVGRGGLVTADPDAVAYPDTMIRARVDRKQMSPEFLRWVWNSSTVRRQIESAAKTTAGIHKVNQQDLGRVAVPFPPPEVQAAIVGDLERQQSILQALTKSIHQALSRSNQLRRSVLEGAFSGRLVPQDPNDEPAPELLARIASDHRKTAKPRRRQRA